MYYYVIRNIVLEITFAYESNDMLSMTYNTVLGSQIEDLELRKRHMH